MISLDLLEAMHEAGLDADGQLRVIRALLAIRARRRLARALSARRSGLAQPLRDLNNHDSDGVSQPADSAGEMNNHDMDGVIDAGDVVIQAPQRAGHVHNGGRKTVARAGLLAHPRLTPAARLVGAQLVEHANLETRRCHPSIGTMARNTGLSGRTVSRAVAELRHRGLVAVAVHGAGRSNSYALDWAALGAAAAGRAAKMNNHDSPAPLTTFSSANHDKNVAEILSQNPETRSGGGARAAPPDWRLPLMVPIAGGRGAVAGSPAAGSPAAGSPAYGAAGQRLWEEIGRQGDIALRRRLLDLVSGHPGLAERATFAELREPGSGLGVLLIAARAPPAQASG